MQFQVEYYYILTTGTGIDTVTSGPYVDYDLAVNAAEAAAGDDHYPYRRTSFKIEKRYVKMEG